MPYIICVNIPGFLPEQDPVAVATLDEAKQYVDSERDRYFSENGTDKSERNIIVQTNALPRIGGVIGPLPDGYVIDVQHVSWHYLANIAGDSRDGQVIHRSQHAKIIDAYNEIT